MTALSDGELYVTTKRLLFCGHSRNTAIPLKKVVNGTIYSDALKLEKNSGKPHLFSMNAGWARYTLSLISVLKQHA